MRKLEIQQMVEVSGGNNTWKTYAGTCAGVGTLLGITGAVPILLLASATYLAVCATLLPLAAASGYLK